MCGYHLRCLNYGKSCLVCGHQHNDKDNDYLHDALNIWSKGKEAAYADENELNKQMLVSIA